MDIRFSSELQLQSKFVKIIFFRQSDSLHREFKVISKIRLIFLGHNNYLQSDDSQCDSEE